MNRYQRIFGAGPRGIVLSVILFALAWQLESAADLPSITSSNTVRWIALVLAVVGSIIIAAWSVKSLPPADRGSKLITTGAFRYFRHPLYASLLSCFNFGLAIWLNNWIYIIWALLLHSVWHWNIRSEERLMRDIFHEEYEKYCKITGRFVPRIWSGRHGGTDSTENKGAAAD